MAVAWAATLVECRLVPARRPPGRAGAAATTGRAEHTRQWPAWAHRERARSMRRGAPAWPYTRCMNMRTTRARRCARAVAATRSRRWRRSASTPARVFKTIVVSVDGRLGLAVVPADAEVDLKAVAGRAGRAPRGRSPRRRTRSGRRGTCWAGSARSARAAPLPTVVDASAGDWPTIHVSAGRRGLEIELAAADLAPADGRRAAPDRPARLSGPRLRAPALRTCASAPHPAAHGEGPRPGDRPGGQGRGDRVVALPAR